MGITIQALKEVLVPKKKIANGSRGLSSGSTLLNLCISGNPYWAYKAGTMHHIVGDSTSGKTFLMLTALAEASIDKKFQKHKLIYDPVEDGAQMNLKDYFGNALANKIKGPPLKDSNREACYTLEEMGACISRLYKEGKPFILVEDSIDALTCKADIKQAEKEQVAAEEDSDGGGSFGTAKARWLSNNLRWIVPQLKEKQSILFLISQAKQNIGFGAMFNPKVHAGGKSLKFFAQTQIWTSVIETFKKPVKGEKMKIGMVIGVKVVKNRMSGKDWEVKLPFYYSHGIDDVGSCVDFLIDKKHFKGKGKGITATGLDIKGSRERIIQEIEENDLEDELIQETTQVWREIELQCTINRKKRYT